jgi:hypothetical protein
MRCFNQDEVSGEESRRDHWFVSSGAWRWHGVRKLLMLAFQISQEAADRHLTRAGAEREIKHLAQLWNRQERPLL